MRLFRTELFPSLPAGRRGDSASSHRQRRYGVSTARPAERPLQIETLTLPAQPLPASTPEPVVRAA